MARKPNPRAKGHGKTGKSGAKKRPADRVQKHSHENRRPAKNTGGGSGNWLWGKHAVEAAIKNPDRKIRAVHTSPDLLDQIHTWADEGGKDQGSFAVEVKSRAEIDSLLPEGAVHQNLALNTVPLKECFIEDMDPGKLPERSVPPLVVVLDQINDPHNIGAILRSAAAFDIDALIVQDRRAPGETGTLAKAASGALEHVPIVQQTNLKRAIEHLKDMGYWCVGFDSEAESAVSEVNWSAPTAIILGAEGKGLRRLIREACDQFVCLPTKPPIASLNVSNAAAIAFYEARRR